MKKATVMRAFACMLALFAVLTAFAFAETATDAAQPAETADAAAEADGAEYDAKGRALNSEGDPEVSILEGIRSIAKSTAFANGEWRQYVMIVIACGLLYLAIGKQFEPLLLLPIAFGMLLANLPLGGLMDDPTYASFATLEEATAFLKTSTIAHNVELAVGENGETIYQVLTANGGILHYLYKGVKLGIYPPLIFMGVGAMTDFGPLIANPKSLLLGAAAQLGIFMTFIGAKMLGFSALEAGAIGIIGGADGPTAIYVATKLAPHLLGAIAVAAYSYMALVPVIQPPIMKALTSKEERRIVMKQLKPVSRKQLVLFPIMVTIVVSLILPSAAPLVGMLMLGNLLHVSGVTERLSKTAQNELCNIVTIFLGVTVGATTKGSSFLTMQTIEIVVLGVIAFSFGTAGGVLLAKLMNLFLKEKINPLIGSAGVSAVPMAARVSQKVGQKENPANFLLMHAMGPNVAGVIGSAVAAGVFIALFG